MSKLDIKTVELVKKLDTLSSMLIGAQVQPDSDLPPHGANETTNSDSYYIVSYLDLVSIDGKYKYKCTTLFHLILVNSVPEKPTALLAISCLSDAGGKLDYFSNEVPNLTVPSSTLINKSNIKSKTLDIEVQPTKQTSQTEQTSPTLRAVVSGERLAIYLCRELLRQTAIVSRWNSSSIRTDPLCLMS